MQGLFIITVFAGAALLFVVQPMSAREVLPLLGGGPAVWTACMLFFQAALLVGYAYAHAIGTRLRPRAQVIAHAMVLAGALVAALWAGAPEGGPPSGAWPVPWLVGTLALTVGPGFFALATAGPLLQRWFAGIGHARSSSPYFLYVASNAGSLLGLVTYPVALEPAATLGQQRALWIGGLALFAVLMTACGLGLVIRGRARTNEAPPDPAPTISWARRGRWLFLAFVPSSLMIGVTSYLSNDIAVFPLLWVLPLAVYLVSFMIAFGRFGGWAARWLGRGSVVVLITLVTAYIASGLGYELPAFVMLGAHLVGFGVVATWIHALLATSAPPAARLTEFYLIIAGGGVLGGVFNAVLAPQLFIIPVEYTLVLAAAGLARPWRGPGLWPGRTGRVALFMLPAALLIVELGLVRAAGGVEQVPKSLHMTLMLAAPAAFGLLASRHGLALGLTLAVGVAASAAALTTRQDTLYMERSFFGTMRVTGMAEDEHAIHDLTHGTTSHGRQILTHIEDLRRMPLSYYHPIGPVGQAMGAAHAQRPGRLRVGVVGLGTGTIAAYTRPGDSVTFYEIDRAVERIARNPNLFTYLSDAHGDVEVVIGDGRRELADAGPGTRYDVLVLDAFSSDAVPIHLLTREAFGVYLDRLNPGGFLLVHVSNRFLDLEPVVADIAASLGAPASVCRFTPTQQEVSLGAHASTWIAIAHPGERLPELPRLWTPLPRRPSGAVWTDDYSNILAVITWWD